MLAIARICMYVCACLHLLAFACICLYMRAVACSCLRLLVYVRIYLHLLTFACNYLQRKWVYKKSIRRECANLETNRSIHKAPHLNLRHLQGHRNTQATPTHLLASACVWLRLLACAYICLSRVSWTRSTIPPMPFELEMLCVCVWCAFSWYNL